MNIKMVKFTTIEQTLTAQILQTFIKSILIRRVKFEHIFFELFENFTNFCRIFFELGFTQRKASTKHRVTKKESTKRLKHTGNLFSKNLQLKGVC